MREGLPQREDRYKRSCNGSPYPSEQQYPRSGPDPVKYGRSDRSPAPERHNPLYNQCNTRHQPHQEKAGTGQTVGECRIKASQLR